jgi:hypothetical protein
LLAHANEFDAAQRRLIDEMNETLANAEVLHPESDRGTTPEG